MDRFTRECRRRNLETQQAWKSFAEHRDRVTALIETAAGGRLCVLGAGNGNDLDLTRLLDAFDDIELVDLDGQAVVAGVGRQKLSGCARIHCRGEVDLTGLVGRFVQQPASESPQRAWSSHQLLSYLQQTPRVSEMRFHSVASVCTLTQLMELVASLAGPQNSHLSELLLATRRQHLRLMLSLLKPGGAGLLITDFVSSDTCPELRDLDSAELPQAAHRWITQHNFFTGTNPFAIKKSLLVEMGELVEPQSAVIHQPWRWDLGPRIYAVSAVEFRRTENPRT